jgi:hypothetical protein
MKTKGTRLLRRKDFVSVILIATVVCGIASLFNNQEGGKLFSVVAKTDTQMRMEQMEKHMKLMEQEIGTLRKR